MLLCFNAVPSQLSVSMNSDPVSPIQPLGSDVTLNCAVELDPAIVESDLSLVMVDAQLSRDGTPLDVTGPTVTGTTFTYTIQLDSFGRSDSGNYTCTATVRPQPTLTFLTGSGEGSTIIEVTTGKAFKITLHLYMASSLFYFVQACTCL